jgi:hypothetical protein
MSNQHTENHNDALTFFGAYLDNDRYDSIIGRHDRQFRDAVIVPIPWKQIHRANVPHLARRSNS